MKSSTWIVALDIHNNDEAEPELMGVVRLIKTLPQSLLSKPHVDSLTLLFTQYSPEDVIELNRFAVSSKFRERGVGRSLLLAVGKYICNKGDNDERPYVATIPVNLAKHYPQQVFEVMKPFGKPFYYEATDPLPAQLYLGEKADFKTMLRKLSTVSNHNHTT